MRRQVKLSAIGETMRFRFLISLALLGSAVLVAQQAGRTRRPDTRQRPRLHGRCRPPLGRSGRDPRVAIVALGTNADARVYTGAGTRTIDLKGAFVSPGFNDAHVHIDSTGALLVGVNLLDVHEPKAFTTRMRDAAGRLPQGSWITRGDWGAYEQWGAGTAAEVPGCCGAAAGAGPFTPHRI